MPDGINYDAFSEALNDKADRDLQNTAAEGKKTSIGWGMPDYSAGISLSDITPTNPFTAPSDGYLVGTVYNGTFFVNGNFIAYADGTTFSFPIIIPLSKNDIITTTATKMNRAVFYPCKGV